MFVLKLNWILVLFSAWCCISFKESPLSFLSHLYLAGLRMADEEYREMGERLSWWVTVHKEGTANSLEQALSVWLTYAGLYTLVHKHMQFLWVPVYALCVYNSVPQCNNCALVCIFSNFMSTWHCFICFSVSSPVSVIPLEFTDHICGHSSETVVTGWH